MRAKTTRIGIGLAVGVLLTGGCGTVSGTRSDDTSTKATGSTSATATARAVDLSILDAGGRGDYRVFDAPEELAQQYAVALAGRIDGFEDGHTVLERESGSEFPDIRLRNAVLRIRIDQVFKAEGVQFPDGFAYLSLSRGAEVIDEDGEPERAAGTVSTITTVAAYANALPKGTPVVVISSPFEYPEDPASQVVERGRGRPGDSTLLTGQHPQLLSVQYGSAGRVSGWRDLSFAELTTRLAARS